MDGYGRRPNPPPTTTHRSYNYFLATILDGSRARPSTSEIATLLALSDSVIQSLREGAIVVIDGLHLPSNACEGTRTPDNCDIRGPLIELPPGDLNAAAFKS